MKRTGVRFVCGDAVDSHELFIALAMTTQKIELVADVGDDDLTMTFIHTGLVILIGSGVM
jgi:hypothetical protein